MMRCIKEKETDGKVIKRVRGGEYINEELLTIETPKDFYKPSQRIKILNADRHPSMQL